MKDNFERLLSHLKEKSLASRLVDAYRSSMPSDLTESMKEVFENRIEEVRKNIDSPKD